MPRILGVDVPKAKRIDIALTCLYGIGRKVSGKILQTAGINPSTRAKDLTEEDVSRIITTIQKSNFKIEGDLRREVSQDIRRLIDIGSWRGLRHRRGLPVRGQRTRTNARTRKGPRKGGMAIVRKEPAAAPAAQLPDGVHALLRHVPVPSGPDRRAGARVPRRHVHDAHLRRRVHRLRGLQGGACSELERA